MRLEPLEQLGPEFDNIDNLMMFGVDQLERNEIKQLLLSSCWVGCSPGLDSGPSKHYE
jgi:hypothetical protein